MAAALRSGATSSTASTMALQHNEPRAFPAIRDADVCRSVALPRLETPRELKLAARYGEVSLFR